MKGNQRMTVKEWVDHFAPETIEAAKSFLVTGCLQYVICGDKGCFDAEFEVDDAMVFAEVTLDASGRVEDMYCNCNIGFCIHLAAMLWQINSGAVIYTGASGETEHFKKHSKINGLQG